MLKIRKRTSFKNISLIFYKTQFLFSSILNKTEVEIKASATNLYNECDLRIGKVMEICNMENSEDIYCLKVDLGEGTLRDIGTGLRKKVPSEEIKDTHVIVFANLKPRKLGIFVSNGMILCSHDEKTNQLEILRANNSKNQI